MNSRWRYNWLPFTGEGAGPAVAMVALLVLLVYFACG
jgi:hypothetical protein